MRTVKKRLLKKLLTFFEKTSYYRLLKQKFYNQGYDEGVEFGRHQYYHELLVTRTNIRSNEHPNFI